MPIRNTFILIFLFVTATSKAQDSMCMARLKMGFFNMPLDSSQNDIFKFMSDTNKFIVLSDSNRFKSYWVKKSTVPSLYDSIFIHTSFIEFQKSKKKKKALGFHYGITYYFNYADTNSQKQIDDWYEYYFQTFAACVKYHTETAFKKSGFVQARFRAKTGDNYPILTLLKTKLNNKLHFINLTFNNLLDYQPGTPYQSKEHKHHHEKSDEDDVETLRFYLPVEIQLPSFR